MEGELGASDGGTRLTCLETNFLPCICSLLSVKLEAGHPGGHAEGWGRGSQGLRLRACPLPAQVHHQICPGGWAAPSRCALVGWGGAWGQGPASPCPSVTQALRCSVYVHTRSRALRGLEWESGRAWTPRVVLCHCPQLAWQSSVPREGDLGGRGSGAVGLTPLPCLLPPRHQTVCGLLPCGRPGHPGQRVAGAAMAVGPEGEEDGDKETPPWGGSQSWDVRPGTSPETRSSSSPVIKMGV